MAIAFVCNQHITMFYRLVADELARRGTQVVWISPSRRWADYLLRHGTDPARVLVVADDHHTWQKPGSLDPAQTAALAELEAQGDFTVNDLILMDRLLIRRPKLAALTYVATAVTRIAAFLARHEVVLAIGESTWMVERVTALVCRQQGARYFQAHTVRIPSTRFGFLDGILQDRLYAFREPGEAERAQARSLLEELLRGGARPHYHVARAGLPPVRRYWLGEAAVALIRAGQMRGDETVPGLYRRTADRLAQYRRAVAARVRPPFELVPLQHDRPFLLFLPHMQPEATIDVYGHRYSNQLEAIRALARLVPTDHDLLVKEHCVAIPSRPRRFYHEVKAIPGVRLIDPNLDTRALISEAALVVTPVGTAALEAGLMGRPAATLMPMYFGPVLSANGLDPYATSAAAFRDLLQAPPVPSREQRERFLAWTLAQSFDGLIADPLTHPRAADPANVASVASACEALARSLRRIGSPDIRFQTAA